jgi:hypothetical protein
MMQEMPKLLMKFGFVNIFLFMFPPKDANKKGGGAGVGGEGNLMYLLKRL